MTETVTVPIEALRNCHCPSDGRWTIGDCTDAGTCGCSIALKQRLGAPAQGATDPFMDDYKRDTIKDLIERCALIVEAECERMLSKQYPASKTGMDFTDTINTNIRMMACHLPNIAASIRALSLPSTSSATPERKFTGPGHLEQTGYIDREGGGK